ncbi:MAG: hypothetical protein ABSH25_00945 [Syntrophorhabdales bacterium]|jgi:hypothetical protein
MDEEAEYLNQALSKRAEGYLIKESVNTGLLRAIGTVREGNACQETPLGRPRCMRPTSRRLCFWARSQSIALPRSIKVCAVTAVGVFSVGGGMSRSTCASVTVVARRIATDYGFPLHTVLTCPNTG